MSPNEAADFLYIFAIRPHVMVTSIAGPSHGDLGGYPVISEACACVIHNGYEFKRIDESIKCTCGNRDHNDKARDALDLLRRVIKKEPSFA